MTAPAPGRWWRPPWLWRAALLLARLVVAPLARVRVTGDVPATLRRGPLLLAANHISPFDPVAVAVACRARRIAPRYLATGALFDPPVVGWLLRHCGHIPVLRGTAAVAEALPAAATALTAGSVVLVYPEGRIGLDPELWPERGRSGVARLALASGVTVVPVAQWGAHEVVPYAAPTGLVRALPRTIVRRPTVRVRFGSPVDLTGLVAGMPGHARRATDRIMDAITRELAILRADEPDRPRHVDPSRPGDLSRRHRGAAGGIPPVPRPRVRSEDHPPPAEE